MSVETAAAEAMTPIMAFALVGALGVGSQWLAWRLRLPAIVLMLAAGLIVGPATGIFDPSRDIGPLMSPMISVAVAIILFEGGMTLNKRSLSDAATGVRRLVFIGAPLGWLTSAIALHYAAGLDWETSAVFGGIMIVTGPTVIAPLLRTARLQKRPANLLQWEAILNDPIGALAAVLAFEFVVVRHSAAEADGATLGFILGLGFAIVFGLACGFGIAVAFRRAYVPEYMKVPVLFTVLLGCFAVSETLLHESGLLAVTLMGVVVANAKLQSYEELRRFKEHATILLVSGVFILLAANLDFDTLARLDWTALLFILSVILIARPLTVMTSLAFSGVPIKERVLVALTGPRGVVLVAVAGLFGERLQSMGLEDGALVGPLAFALVAATVVLHGFTLGPLARALGLSGSGAAGVIIVGGSRWTTALGEAVDRAGVPVLVADPNHVNLRLARTAGLPTFMGDILSEAAEDRLEWVGYQTVVAATDNDAYNTLVATDLGPEFGRNQTYQVQREKSEIANYTLPTTLGGMQFGPEKTRRALDDMIEEGWTFRVTKLSEEFTFEDWRNRRPDAHVIAYVPAGEGPVFVRKDEQVKATAGVQIISMLPPGTLEGEASKKRPHLPDDLPDRAGAGERKGETPKDKGNQPAKS
ncbi:sodium:proton antiporter [Marivivens donghaensis]|uniref:Sodium:proton antiporter n=1 Tax=Marivivens donghaensis TaxID=1699413 RepID=A0ABX0VZD8_9RHOB|nr:sodium:proton antiporter [Marivivens donghaensis]NIY73125.1 sodium:proton antiporter [Marivivens donghaensis]